jgi:DNA-binding transcriptional LysR family regulator
MEIQQVRAFVAIAESGRMSAAAKRLGVTQPAVSLSIGQLERELQAPLFHRAPAGLTLTVKGEELLPKARLLLATAQEIVAVAEASQDDRGELRISGRPGFLEYVFPILQKKLKQDLPQIRITSIHSGTANDVVEHVRLGRADLGFAASPGIKSISAEVIFQDPVWLAVSAGSTIARKRDVVLADLRHMAFCVPVAEDRLRPAINALLKKIGVSPRQVTETNDYTVMKNLIAEGGYVGFVYAHMLLAEHPSHLRPLRISEFDVVRDLTVLHRRDDTAPHALRARELLIQQASKALAMNVARFRKS